MVTDFKAKVQAQPWYSQVKAEFDAQGVPEDDWESILHGEDSSLNPSAQNTKDPGPYGSVGLFQLNTDASIGGLGVGHSLSELVDPVQNAAIAAPVMAGDLKYSKGSSLDQELQALSGTWNSMLDPQNRMSAEVAVGAMPFSQEPTNVATDTGVGGGGISSSSPSGDSWLNGPLPVTTGTPSLTNPLGGLPTGQGWSNLATNIFVGGVILALIAGGFAIMASASKITPVPVPV